MSAVAFNQRGPQARFKRDGIDAQRVPCPGIDGEEHGTFTRHGDRPEMFDLAALAVDRGERPGLAAGGSQRASSPG